jgi:membrane-associated phospholipid phosphatase
MISTQAIMHVAEDPTLQTLEEPPLQMTMSDAGNMEGWDGWVRASLYLTDFLRDMNWSVDTKPGAEQIALLWQGTPFVSLQRPSTDVFQRQLALMRDYMDQRHERAAEILSQLGYPIDYFATIMGLNAARNRYTFELIAMTQVITSHVAMVAKHHLACRRPDRFGPTVMPMIPTPGHGTFPSAHAAEAFAAATVLDGLLEAIRPTRHYSAPETIRRLIYKQAERIAVNRTVAGMHFPVDTWAGATLGVVVGRIIVAKGSKDGGVVEPQIFAPRSDDFSITAFKPNLWIEGRQQNHSKSASEDKGVHVKCSDLFAWLWGKCAHEFELK